MWPKTGTGSSFRPHFGKKTIFGSFWGFLVPVAMCKFAAWQITEYTAYSYSSYALKCCSLFFLI